MAIGRPGIMKSPPLNEIMRPIQALQARSQEQFGQEKTGHKAAKMVADEAEKVTRDTTRKMIKQVDPPMRQKRQKLRYARSAMRLSVDDTS